METPTYKNSSAYSTSDIDSAMRKDWLYRLTGGAFVGNQGRQIQAQMNQANEFALETALMDYENWYNSPAEQLSRRNAAGLGSGSIENFGAAETSVPGTNVQAGSGSDLVHAGANILNIAIQGYQFITSAVARMAEIDNMVFDTASKSADLLLTQSIPYLADKSDIERNMLAPAVSNATQFVDEFMKSLPSRKHKKYLKHRIESLRNTGYHRTLFNEQKFRELHAGQESIKVESDPRNQGSVEEIFTAWNDFMNLFVDAEQKAFQSSSSRSTAEKEYFDAYEGSKSAQSENYDNSYKAVKEGFIKNSMDVINDVLKDSKPWVKSLAEILVRWLAARLDAQNRGIDSGVISQVVGSMIK